MKSWVPGTRIHHVNRPTQTGVIIKPWSEDCTVVKWDDETGTRWVNNQFLTEAEHTEGGG